MLITLNFSDVQNELFEFSILNYEFKLFFYCYAFLQKVKQEDHVEYGTIAMR